MGLATWIPRHWQRMYRLLPDQFPTNAQQPTGSAWEHLIATVADDSPVSDIVEVDGAARTLVVNGDQALRYPVDFLAEVGGSSLVPRAFDGANDGRFTVTAVSYDAVGDRTTITVAEEFACPTCAELGFLRGNDTASTTMGIQEVEEVLFDLRNAWNLTQATGAMLERLGEILGLSRTSTDDDEYRNDLRIQAAINNSNGRHFQIIDAVAALTGVTIVVARDVYPAHIRLQIVGSLPASGTRDRIFSMKGGGISMVIVASGTTNPFVYTGDAAHVASFGGGFGGHFTITAVTVGGAGAGSFGVAGDITAVLDAGDPLQVKFSTGNDEWYTIAASSFAAGTTTIDVDEAVVNAVVDGIIYYGSQTETGHLAGIFGL